MFRLSTRRFMLATAGMLAALLTSNLAMAQGTRSASPSGPIRIVVAFGIGGPLDTMARLMADRLSKDLKVPVVVENKPGAGGLLAAREVAGAQPDGNTLLYTAGSAYAASPFLYPQMSFDMHKQLAPVSYGHRQDIVLVVNGKLPIQNFREFVEYAKANSMNYGSGGAGSAPHLIAEIFKKRLGFDAVHVPYKSGAEMLRANLAMETHFTFDALSNVVGNIRSGALRAIVVCGDKPNEALPGVPTLSQTGVSVPSDLRITSWGAMLAPVSTPKQTISVLHAAMDRILRDPELTARLKKLGAEPVFASPEQLRADAERDMALWGSIIKELNITRSN